MPKETPDPSLIVQDEAPTRPEKDFGITNNGDIDVESHAVQGEKASNPRNASAFKSLGWLDRFLAVWILLAMVVGIILGNFVSGIGEALEKGKFVGVSVPIAWAFLPDEPELRVGLILVGLARCIAMVLIWNGLAGGDSEYCAILVAINSILQMALYAPMSVFFIRIISGETGATDVSYSVVARSVAVFLGIPLGAAVITRFSLRAMLGSDWYERIFLRFASPWSLIGLLYTILVLFASQGHQVVHQVVSVVRVAAPLVVYFVVIFFSTLLVARRAGFGYPLSTTQSFTAASNNFELAIAVAIATYGPSSDQALAATVGPLIEVPVLLALVYLLRWVSGRWGWE
ncbi:hypothetical protein G7Z17_g1137 [Cylindrodendrum hubeiense]|uniref:Arsenite transporter n=1 Tax=Cylindrodendrum hubeiense TaxID=595255 RepID=A0A9P5LLP7_9HYPO|nr:hypothetical protein G7Z17_g1137 [Cylindrodendrum hubeiense]